MIYSYKNATPKLAQSVFVAPNAAVIGDVEIGEDSSVWFNSVIRGDVHQIRIGEKNEYPGRLSSACDLPKMGTRNRR